MPDADPDERRCPVCDDPVVSVAVIGPDVAIVSPCGHRVSPHDVGDEGDDSN